MALQKPIHGIFFDLGWTLLYPPSGNFRFSPFAQKLISRAKLEALPKARVNAAVQEGNQFLDRNHLLTTVEEEFSCFLQYYTMLSEALPELGLTEAELRAIAEDKVYNKKDNYCLYPDTIKTLEALKGNYKLGIISDTWPSIVPLLEYLGIRSYFDCVTYSYTLGTYKPDPRMYRDALEKMGLPPKETLFVDDFTGNLQGAQKFGIQPLLICSKPDPDEPGEMEHIFRISELLEFL